MTVLTRLNLKIGTKAQYNTNKASLTGNNTFVMTPLASEFTSNTTAGKGQFVVNGTTITTLAGTVGNNTANAEKPVYLNAGTITALSNSSGTVARPVYLNAGAITPVNVTSATAGSHWATTTGSIPVVTTGGNAELGGLKLWKTNASTYYTNVVSTEATANRTITFPDAAGTVALVGSATVGSETNPVYVTGGKITASTSTVGAAGQPVYLKSGTITACTTTSNTKNSHWSTANNVVPFTNTTGNTNVGKGVYMYPTNDGEYYGLISPTTLTANRTYTLPDASGTVMLTANFKDTAYTASAYHSIYFAGADNTAGAIPVATGIGMAAEATLSFNPSTKKFKYTTTDGTALNFGLTKVATW